MTTLPFLLKVLLTKNNYHINFDELKLQLLSHPSYPSLHSITGVLDHFNVDNIALEVPQNIETLKQLPKNFITLISNKNEFIVVTQLENSIMYIDSTKKATTIEIDEFLEIWKGVIVVIEKQTINESAKKIDDKIITTIFYSIGIIFFIGLFFFTKPSLFESLHFMLVLIGLQLAS